MLLVGALSQAGMPGFNKQCGKGENMKTSSSSIKSRIRKKLGFDLPTIFQMSWGKSSSNIKVWRWFWGHQWQWDASILATWSCSANQRPWGPVDPANKAGKMEMNTKIWISVTFNLEMFHLSSLKCWYFFFIHIFNRIQFWLLMWDCYCLVASLPRGADHHNIVTTLS